MFVKLEQGKMEDLHGRDVLLFGAGSLGVRSLEEMDKIGAKVLGFLDNNRARAGEKLEGYMIYAPEDISRFQNVKVIITSTYMKEIKKQLSAMGNVDFDVICLGALRDKLPEKDFFKPFLSKSRANELLYQRLSGKEPFFAGRIGSNELECMVEYYYLLHRDNGGIEAYHNNLKLVMKQGAGFFPAEEKYLDEMAKLYADDLRQMDFIWSMWLSKFEDMLYRRFNPEAVITKYEDTAFPYDIASGSVNERGNETKEPWTYALSGRKVLVIHPFVDSIKQNYKIREKLHKNKMLPGFTLVTMKPVQSIADEETAYDTWFDALETMEKEISKIDFDVALIGAGAYGLPLGAYCKRIGKQAVHVGGMLQLYFGIRGKYYDKYNYHNEYWTRPMETERPKGFEKVEAGRYW